MLNGIILNLGIFYFCATKKVYIKFLKHISSLILNMTYLISRYGVFITGIIISIKFGKI